MSPREAFAFDVPVKNSLSCTLEAALSEAGGVVTRAAAILGLSRQALYRRMERHGVSVKRVVR